MYLQEQGLTKNATEDKIKVKESLSFTGVVYLEDKQKQTFSEIGYYRDRKSSVKPNPYPKIESYHEETEEDSGGEDYNILETAIHNGSRQSMYTKHVHSDACTHGVASKELFSGFTNEDVQRPKLKE